LEEADCSGDELVATEGGGEEENEIIGGKPFNLGGMKPGLREIYNAHPSLIHFTLKEREREMDGGGRRIRESPEPDNIPLKKRKGSIPDLSQLSSSCFCELFWRRDGPVVARCPLASVRGGR
jgi:hypothetical protein